MTNAPMTPSIETIFRMAFSSLEFVWPFDHPSRALAARRILSRHPAYANKNIAFCAKYRIAMLEKVSDRLTSA
jgi:hypothetical protein